MKKTRKMNKLSELLAMCIQSPPGRRGYFWHFDEKTREWVEYALQDEVPTGRKAPINWGREHI